jgi:predicted aconitase with swiveling domain
VVPLALVFKAVNPILAQGAAFGDVPMLAGFDLDITSAVPNGASVVVDPAAHTMTVVDGRSRQ